MNFMEDSNGALVLVSFYSPIRPHGWIKWPESRRAAQVEWEHRDGVNCPTRTNDECRCMLGDEA